MVNNFEKKMPLKIITPNEANAKTAYEIQKGIEKTTFKIIGIID
jgi:hypothetical protein